MELFDQSTPFFDVEWNDDIPTPIVLNLSSEQLASILEVTVDQLPL